jgi:hypothetical protein
MPKLSKAKRRDTQKTKAINYQRVTGKKLNGQALKAARQARNALEAKYIG